MTGSNINRIPTGRMNATPLSHSGKIAGAAALPVDSFVLTGKPGDAAPILDPRKAAAILTQDKVLVCEKLWDFESGADVVSSASRGPGDIVTFGGREDRQLFAVDGKTGDLKWKVKLKGKIQAAAVWDSEGTLYLGDTENQVYAFDGQTGKEKWKFKTKSYVNTSPQLTKNGTLLVQDGKYIAYGIDSSTGKKNWEFQAKDDMPANPYPGPDGKIYVRSGKLEIQAIDEKTGKVEHTYTTETEITSPHVVRPDGTIYCTVHGDRAVAIDGKTGETKWRGVGDEGGTPMQGPGNTLLTGVHGEGFNVLDMNTGKKLWSFDANDYLTGPPVVGPDGNIYVSSYENKTYSLNPKGQKLWEYKPGGSPSGSPAPGEDGVMFVMSGKGKLTALKYNKALFISAHPGEVTFEPDTGDAGGTKPGTIEKGKGFVEIGGVRLEVKERPEKS